MDKIVVKNLKYKYPSSENLILNDISFNVKEGEIFGIIGKNKSGKSTLAQSLVGLVPHFYSGSYGGKVLINNIDARNSNVSELCKKVGIVFQNPFNQITGSKYTVYEEIAFGLENIGISKAEMIHRIDRVLNILKLYDLKEKNPFELSGGQTQRLAIASILAMKPEIIVLDEPTSQLDPIGTEEIFDSINRLSEEGITIVLIEHKIEKIAKYCDRIMLLDDGKIIDIDEPKKIFSRNDLSKHGINYPIYTELLMRLDLKDTDGLYPVTLENTYDVLVNIYGKY